MAKKRIAGVESAMSGTGPAPAREHRWRNKVTPESPASSPKVEKSPEPRASGAEPGSAVSPSLGAGAAASERAPEYQEIAKLAYYYWEARGRQGGSAEEDWLRAERELQAGKALRADA